jgi:hypothetical protein
MLRILLSSEVRKNDTPLRCGIVMNKREGRVNVEGGKGMRGKKEGEGGVQLCGNAINGEI